MTGSVAELSYNVIKYGTIILLAVSFIVLIVFSVLVHDTYYIREFPLKFVSETLIMGFLTAISIVYISVLRGNSRMSSFIESLVIFFKVVLLHIGFQLSGVYSVLFPKSSNLENASV